MLIGILLDNVLAITDITCRITFAFLRGLALGNWSGMAVIVSVLTLRSLTQWLEDAWSVTRLAGWSAMEFVSVRPLITQPVLAALPAFPIVNTMRLLEDASANQGSSSPAAVALLVSNALRMQSGTQP